MSKGRNGDSPKEMLIKAEITFSKIKNKNNNNNNPLLV